MTLRKEKMELEIEKISKTEKLQIKVFYIIEISWNIARISDLAENKKLNK